MIICPNCKHAEFDGALFCSECGSQIVLKKGVETDALRLGTNNFLEDRNVPEKALESPVLIHQAVVTLIFTETGQVMPLSGKDEFSLGRISQGQVIFPDIDLTELNGYENGVSRVHATIRVQTPEVTLTDLGSSNGTRLNGTKLVPHKAYGLKNGDRVALGKLRFEVVIREQDPKR